LFAAYQDQSQAIQCDDNHRPAEDPKDRQVCQFDLKAEFGENCSKENDYGFKDGKPCILIKINKVLSVLSSGSGSGSQIKSFICSAAQR